MVNLVKKKSFHGEIWMQCCEKKNLVKTWWKPGEIHKLGEITVKLPKLGENLVKFRNLVKTWWKLGENLVKYINLVKTWWNT